MLVEKDDGTLQGAHKRQLEASKRRRQGEDVNPEDIDIHTLPFPQELAELWSVYATLSRTRSPDSPLLFREIGAYSFLYGVEFAPWEVDVLLDLDAVFTEVVRARPSRTKS